MSEAIESEAIEETSVEETQEESVEAEESAEEGYEESEGEEASEDVEVQAETTEELQDEIDQAIEDGASQKEVANMVKKFKLKVHGKEIEKEIDLSDEDQLRQELQMAAAGRKSMQEVAELKKTMEAEIRRLQEDPWGFMRDYDLDPEELNERYMEERIEELKKSPEQLAREQMEREFAELRAKEEEAQRKIQEIEFQRLQEEAQADIENQITEALSAHTKIPNSRRTREKIASAMLEAMDLGYEDVRVEDVMPVVEQDLKREFEEYFNEMPADLIEEYIGKRNLEKLREKRLKAAKKKGTGSNKPKPVAKTSESKEKSPKSKKLAKDFFRSL